MVVGSPWARTDYAALISAQRARGLRFAALFYDLIPLRHPEWCDPGIVRSFRAWVDSLLPLCDCMFAISRATADDVSAYAEERGIAVPQVVPLPMGSGSRDGTPDAGAHAAIAAAPGTYAPVRLHDRVAKEPRVPVPAVAKRCCATCRRVACRAWCSPDGVGWFVDVT